MLPLKSDMFLLALAGLYLLSRHIGEIGAKRVLWGIVWFINTPCSDSHDERGRADGRADRPGPATRPGDLFSTLTLGGRMPRRPEAADPGRGRRTSSGRSRSSTTREAGKAGAPTATPVAGREFRGPGDRACRPHLDLDEGQAAAASAAATRSRPAGAAGRCQWRAADLCRAASSRARAPLEGLARCGRRAPRLPGPPPLEANSNLMDGGVRD
jgi:hypothetical protein